MHSLRKNWLSSRLKIAALAVLFLFPSFSSGQGNEQVFIGTRPMGMGETFVAVADDGNTIYWNPAGLPGLRRHEIMMTYSNLYGLGIINSYLGYVFPFRDEFSVGVDWYYLGFNDDELGYSSNKMNFSFGFQPFRWFSVGTNVKYIINDMSLDGTSYGKSSGIGWDVGLLFSPWQSLRIGLVGYDIRGTSVTYDNNVSEEILPKKIKGGLAWMPVEGAIVAVDVDDRWHLGAEYWVSGVLGLRAGFQRDRKIINKTSSPLIPSFGVSLRYKFINIDYGYEHHPLLFSTHRVSISFLFRPALVTIKSASIRHPVLFRSLYHYYEDHGFADVTIRNSSDRDLPIKLSLFVPTMMETPYEEKIILPAKSTDDYSLGVTFDQNILTSSRASFDNLIQPVVKVIYSQEGLEKVAVQKIDRTYVLGRGKISWDNPDRIASFVTPEDPVVDQFARTLIQLYNPIIRNDLNRSNLGKAMILFDALGTYGLTYSPDLQTPFLQISKDRSAFDTVKYPSELLKSKIGDCDDLTVLYGSLLENMGISTRFLDVFAPGEGHIFLMFDSGVSPDDVSQFFLDKNEIAVANERVWIPVETTLVGEPFFTAWQQGIFEYQKRKSEGTINEISIHEAQQTYRPGSIDTVEIPLPKEDQINNLLKTDLKQYGLWLQQIVLKQIGELASAEDYYDAGAIYLKFTRLAEAMEMFNTALKLKPDFPDALNSLGVIRTRKGEYEQAMNFYNRSLELFPNHPGFKLNIALTHYIQGNKILAQQEYNEVVKLDPNFAGELDILLGLRKRKQIQTMEQLVVGTENIPEISRIKMIGKEKVTPSKKMLELFQRLKKKPVKSVRRAKSINGLGLIYVRKGKLEKAVDSFRRAYEFNPEETEYLVNLAVVHYMLGQYDQALEEYDEIVRQNPELTLSLRFIKSRGVEQPKIRRFE